MNKRKENRITIYRPSRAEIYAGSTPDSFHNKKLRPIITNISFNGIGLITFPELKLHELEELLKGNHFLKTTFSLPPSVSKIEVDCILRWSSTINMTDFSYTRMGLEFMAKTQSLFREIDNFFKSPSPGSLIYKNQRFFPRIHSNIPIKISFPKLSFLESFFHKTFHAVIKNISATGMLIRIDDYIKPSLLEKIRKSTTRIPVSFHIPAIEKKFNITLRPIHIQVSKTNCLMGLKIIKITPEETALIAEYVAVRKALFLKTEISE